MDLKEMIKSAIMLTIIVAISSCSFNIKGNYLTLVPYMSSSDKTKPLDERGLVDDNGTPILRLSSIYFSFEGGKEYITLIYNNNDSETLEVSSKSSERESVLYVLGNKHNLGIAKNDDIYHVTFMRNFYKPGQNRYTEFAKVTSINTVSR